jgi:hypothetical protein
MEDFIPDCRECGDGADLYKGDTCPICGRPGKKERPETHRQRNAMRQEVIRSVNSSQFQEQVKLARRTLQIPEAGLSRDEALNSIAWQYWACATTYLWTLELFQRKVLAIKEQDKREEYFRQTIGPYAPLLACLTYPNNRTEFLDGLIAGKLIAARLSSWLQIDNVPEIFFYLLCPELSPPESWKLHYIEETRVDPFLRQLERFIAAALPLPEGALSRNAIREQAEAAACLAYQMAKGDTTWEENRRMFATFFPSLSSDYVKKHQMRAKRAAKRLPYKDIVLEVTRRALNKGEIP